MNTTTVTLPGPDVFHLVRHLIVAATWFEVAPLPHGMYEVTVKEDFEQHLRKIVARRCTDAGIWRTNP